MAGESYSESTAMRNKKGETQKRGAGVYNISKNPDSVIRINRQCGAIEVGDHPAVFPVGLPAYIVDVWAGSVYEPFLGSGTTLIACEQLGRKCYGLEIDPSYCDVIVQRWENLTGGKAVLEEAVHA